MAQKNPCKCPSCYGGPSGTVECTDPNSSPMEQAATTKHNEWMVAEAGGWNYEA